MPPLNRVMILTAVLVGFFWSATANAIPAWARKYEMNCSACHIAFPQLNAQGRDFKLAGYRFGTEKDKAANQNISDFLEVGKYFPVSAVLVSRPYDKKDSGDKKNRALHEVELIVGGVIGQQFSGYLEMEAEDEEDFSPEVAPAVLTYNLMDEFNVQAVWGPAFWADPYGILGDHFRLTRGHVGAIDQKFGGADADGRFRSTRQNVGIYGRFAGKLFYNANWSGSADDAEGEDADIYSGSLAYDITDNFMIGGFGMSGSDSESGRDFTRVGVQAQADIYDARIQALYITADDDREVGSGEDSNDAISVQAFWTFRDDGLRPTFVPLVRYDTYESNDGDDSTDELTLNLAYYITQNVKVYVEYWDRFDAPTNAEEDSRWTLQIVAAF